MKYVYTAVFTAVDDGYSVSVPDLPGCITGGQTIADALSMVEDAAAMWLWDAENKQEPIPQATPLEQVETAEGQIKSLVLLDTDEYRRENDSRAIKKTLTIPSWLNTEAERAGVNFSQILQDGLKSRLGIQ